MTKRYDSGACFSNVKQICLVLAIILITLQDQAQAYSGAKYADVCNKAIGLAEGDFGALISAIAGMGAIIASAMGGFKAAWALLVVSVGCFILTAWVDLFFQGCN